MRGCPGPSHTIACIVEDMVLRLGYGFMRISPSNSTRSSSAPTSSVIRAGYGPPPSAPSLSARAIACSISRCDCTPTRFRNWRMLWFRASSSIVASRPTPSLKLGPLLQPETSHRRAEPGDAHDRHLGNEGPDERVYQAEGNGEDADKDIGHGGVGCGDYRIFSCRPR